MKNIARNNGITLLEAILAILIITIAGVTMLQFYIASIGLAQVNKNGTIATGHLSNIMEAIKCTPFNRITNDFPNGVAGGPTGNEYPDLIGGYVLSDEQITVSYVNTASDPLEITVSDTWRDVGGVNHTRYLVTKRTR